MTTAFDPLAGILTAICVLFLSGLVVGFVGGWFGHWWCAKRTETQEPVHDRLKEQRAREIFLRIQQAGVTVIDDSVVDGIRYGDLQQEPPLHVQQAEDVARAAIEGKSSWYKGEKQ